MKKITILIFLFGFSQGKLQAQTNDMGIGTSFPSIIESVFTSNKLSQKDLEAFQNRALQKIQEFEECLQIINNPTEEKSLKEHTLELVKSMFVQKSKVILIGENQKIVNEKNINDYLFNSAEISNTQTQLAEQKILQPFQLQANSFYKGKVSYKLFLNGTSELPTSKRVIEIWLQKVPKQFGLVKYNVWEVKLGDLEIQ